MARTNGWPAKRLLSPADFVDRHFTKVALGPVVLLLTVAGLLPFLLMLRLSFTDYSFNLPGHDGHFVGFSNYARALIDDQRFHSSLRVQLFFIVLTIPIELLFGLGIALAIWRGGVRKYVLPLFAVPLLLAPVTVGMIWRLILHGDYGPIGYYLPRIPGVSVQSILGSPSSAFLAIVAIDIWQWTPFFIIVMVSALYTLPNTPFEAALIDGATAGRVFWTLTLPLLRPAITVAVLIRLMDSFKEFDKIFVLTRGGPASSTELISVYTWIVSFDHGELGYGSAVTVIVYLIIYFVSAALFSVARKDWASGA